MIVKENLSVSEGHYHSKCKRTNFEGEFSDMGFTVPSIKSKMEGWHQIPLTFE